MEIDPAIQKVEFKFTALPEDEGRVLDFLAGRQPQQRTVCFYDTKDLRLLKQRGVVLRGRLTEGVGKSTVKLRPVEIPVALAAQAENDKVEIELDAIVGSEGQPSAKLDRDVDDPSAIATGERDELFSGKQQKLVKQVAGDDAFKDLEVLGPIVARVWQIDAHPDFPYDLAAEEWSAPGEHFIELSIKVKPGKADAAQAAFRGLLTGLVKQIEGDRSRKTERMLERLAGALTDG